MMCRYQTAIFGILILLSTLHWSAAAETAAPETLDDSAAKMVWQRLVESQDNLDILDKTKLVTGVPLIASDDAASAPAAVLATMVCYLDGEHGNVSGILSGELAMTIRTIILGQEMDPEKKAKLVKRIRPIWTAVCQEYNQDICKAAQVFRKKASKGKCYAMAIQTHYDKADDLPPLERMAKAVTSFLMARDLHVSAAVEEASWERCCEALNRDMPFVCSFGPHGANHLYVCIGYIEGDGKRYLVALDPTQCNSKTGAAARTIPDRSRSIGAESATIVDAVGGGDPIFVQNQIVQSQTAPLPGTIIIPVSLDRVPCLFVHNMQRDKQAVQSRVNRLLLQKDDENGTKR